MVVSLVLVLVLVVGRLLCLNNNYVRGRRFEYRTKKFFESLGFFVVRTAGSHSPFDLLCFRNEFGSCRLVLVQCKYGGSRMSKKELDEFDRLCTGLACCGYVAMTDEKGHFKFLYVPGLPEDVQKMIYDEAGLRGVEELNL